MLVNGHVILGQNPHTSSLLFNRHNQEDNEHTNFVLICAILTCDFWGSICLPEPLGLEVDANSAEYQCMFMAY